MSIKAAVLTISDRCAAGISEDKSGPLICQFLTSKGFLIVQRSVVPDIKHQIQVRLQSSKVSKVFKVLNINRDQMIGSEYRSLTCYSQPII
jgi:molybdopterin biosynthesis enzyme MoaB